MGRERHGVARTVVAVCASAGLVAALTAAGVPHRRAGSSAPAARQGRVLLVGTYKGHRGKYRTIQAAADASHPGDWILVAPGVYHEADDAKNPPTADYKGAFGGVVITTPRVHLRGMDRAGVIVDGTKAGSSTPCPSDPSLQNPGALDATGSPYGRNGIVVSKADGVSIENLTVCNFLAGSADGSGNEIWWDGGYETGKIGMKGYVGRYLTATSTYFADNGSAAKYGIFSSNARGPAKWSTIYASNFSDSGMYVGACLQVCDVVIDHAWMQYSALGYSGTNSGGAIIVKNSEFDHNTDGFDTNTQLEGDPPAPQDGACPGNKISPITHTHSCWVFMHNNVHDNNNANVPRTGNASEGPTGTGMTISGGRNDTVMDNTFANNGAWGVVFLPFPDPGTPSLDQTCSGTGGVQNAAFGCVYEAQGNALLHNTFSHNGFFGNPSNADYAQLLLNAGTPQNCFRDNTAPTGSAPAGLEQSQPKCGPITAAANTDAELLGQLLCDTGVGSCPPGSNYPKTTGVVMQPLPKNLKSMPNPCKGVPNNAWCVNGKPA
jgi:hypothetical protein